jgi:hypothetical protein
MAKKPCNCQQAAPAMSATRPAVGAIRQALSALGPPSASAAGSSTAGVAQRSSMVSAATSGPGLDLADLLALVRANPGLKITLSFDPAPQVSNVAQFG